MKTFKDKARVKVMHRPSGRWLYGTLCTLRGSYTESNYYRDKYRTYEIFVAEQMRRGQCSEVWGNQDPGVLCSSAEMRAKLQEKRDACIAIEDGEEISVDGEIWRARITGDFSDFLHFKKVSCVKTDA